MVRGEGVGAGGGRRLGADLKTSVDMVRASPAEDSYDPCELVLTSCTLVC